MATLIDFRRRIRSVKNTQQITRAMKFVAAARLRRAQERVLAARPYANQIIKVLRSAMARMENPYHPLMARRPEKRILVVVVTSDKGLCGAFSTNAIRKAVEFLRRNRGKQSEVIAVGKKGRDALRKQQWNVVASYLGISMRVEFSQAKEIAERASQEYAGCEVDAVYGIYNEFKSVMTQRLIVEKLLPIDPEVFATQEENRELQQVDYLYMQPYQEIFDRLLPRYVETEVFRVLLESSAAEHAARMTAMDSATNNAADLIDSLTLEMNKIRQASITTEIIEVVSGAASAGQ